MKFSNIFPDRCTIENISVDCFADIQHLIQRFVYEANRRDRASVVLNLNIHAANIANKSERYKSLLQGADALFCDGSGIQLAAQIKGKRLKKVGGYWMADAIAAFAKDNKTVYLLGGESGIAEGFINYLETHNITHSIIGHHHGYIAHNPEENQAVLDEITRLKPDVLIVGMGMPIQEFWIDDHRDILCNEANVSLIIPIGAQMDYYAGKLPFCPAWISQIGLEWLYRLCNEPKRLFTRYVLGNPIFIYRILRSIFIKPEQVQLESLTN